MRIYVQRGRSISRASPCMRWSSSCLALVLISSGHRIKVCVQWVKEIRPRKRKTSDSSTTLQRKSINKLHRIDNNCCSELDRLLERKQPSHLNILKHIAASGDCYLCKGSSFTKADTTDAERSLLSTKATLRRIIFHLEKRSEQAAIAGTIGCAWR